MQLEHWISHAAAHNPGKTAIHYRGATLDYAAFEHLISRLAWLMRHRFQLRAGDRVAHLARNSPVFLALLFACARLGTMLVPLNFRLAPAELAYLLEDAGPRMLFGDEALLSAAREVLPRGCQMVALDGPAGRSSGDHLPALLHDSQLHPSSPRSSDPSAPLLIVYTSGTTGRPKGAVLDQNALRWNALNSQHMHALTHDDHILSVLPFFHVGGINIQTLPAFHFGATVTLLREFDALEILEIIDRARPTLTVLVPTQMQALCALPKWPDTDLSSLRAVTTGSTWVQTPLLDAWRARGVKTLQVYGCTESSPIAISQCIDESDVPPDALGRPAKYCEVRIVDDDGRPVPPARQGEIELRGPNIMRGYWNNPEATAAAFNDGWLATGDIGYRDEAGYYRMVDRKKNVIISGGENIYPAEVEQALLQHPEIEQVAVVGVPDPRWGETVAAAIVRRVGSRLDEAAVLSSLEARIGRYKFPRRILFLTDLPRNAMGKIVHAEVRSRFGEQSGTGLG